MNMCMIHNYNIYYVVLKTLQKWLLINKKDTDDVSEELQVIHTYDLNIFITRIVIKSKTIILKSILIAINY